MRTRRLTAIVTAVALAAVPAGALAQSGEDQYCDPFEGCSTGGGDGAKPQPQRTVGAKPIPRKLYEADLVERVQASELDRLQRAAARGGADRAQIEAYRDQLRLQQARAVLDAAGLSSLRLTVR